MKRSLFSVLVSLALMSVILCGCGSSSYETADFTSASMSASGVEENGYDMAVDNAYEPESALNSESAELSQSSETEEKIITTVNLQAETNDFDQLSLWLTERAASLGGYVESSDEYSDYDGYKSGNFTLRIPADSLNGFLTDISGESNITSKNVSTENVTLTYVDLESHIEALKTEQTRLLELMEQAESLEDLITLEDKLTDIRYELESYTSQLRVYDNRIDYATVYVDIYEVRDYSEPEPETFWDRVETGFVNTARSIGSGFEEFAIFLLSALPAIALLAVIVIVVIVIIKIAIKKKHKKRIAAQQKAEDVKNQPEIK